MADCEEKSDVISGGKVDKDDNCQSLKVDVGEEYIKVDEDDSKFSEEDSVEVAIEGLEKTLQNCETDYEIDNEICKNITKFKRIRQRQMSESTEHSYVVLDEVQDDSELLNDLNSFSCDNSEALVINNSPSKLVASVNSASVSDNLLQKCGDDNSSIVSQNSLQRDHDIVNHNSMQKSDDDYPAVISCSSPRGCDSEDDVSVPCLPFQRSDDNFVTVIHSSPQKLDEGDSVVVIHNSPLNSGKDDLVPVSPNTPEYFASKFNSLIVIDSVDSDSKCVSISNNSKKDCQFTYDSKLKEVFPSRLCDTPNSISSKKTFHRTRITNKQVVTSTPYRQSCLNNESMDCNSSSSLLYQPPARSIVEKWKPSCLNQTKINLMQNIDQGIEDISVIECQLDSSNKSSSQNTMISDTYFDDKTEIMKKNEFEEAFQNLYTTLFGDNNEKDVTSLNSNAKLKLYHENIKKQHKQDSDKFNEIILEISSISNTSSKVCAINSKHDLSIINEESGESSDDKTVVHEVTVVNKIDETVKSDLDEDELKLNLDETENEAADVIEKDNEDDLLEKEILEVPVINGANSIIYLNNKELTLDEEDALLNDDDLDVISLVCSDIEGVTPRTDISDKSVEVIIKPHDIPVLTDGLTNSKQIPISCSSDGVMPVAQPAVTVSVPPPVSCVDSAANILDIKEATPIPVAPVNDKNAIFVSDNPKENEDNNDPEWEHLRRLSNDQERYKALRERWHSIVIPDPNLDLTSQTFRQRRITQRNANKNQTSTVTNNNSTENNIGGGGSRKRRRSPDEDDGGIYCHHLNKRRKLCTLLFQQNIESLLTKLEYKRYCIHQEMDRELIALAIRQEEEYAHYNNQNINLNQHTLERLLRDLHIKQTNDVCSLRKIYVDKIKMAEIETHEYVSALNAATEEVLTFHKFYQDLDSANNNTSSSMYLSDTQIQELVETEHMLELYSKFYSN